jgi:hypothetical protein
MMERAEIESESEVNFEAAAGLPNVSNDWTFGSSELSLPPKPCPMSAPVLKFHRCKTALCHVRMCRQASPRMLSCSHSYRPIHPPSTVKTSPLTYALAALAKNTTAPLKSSGAPHRPAGILSRICLARVSFAIKASFMSVSM